MGEHLPVTQREDLVGVKEHEYFWLGQLTRGEAKKDNIAISVVIWQSSLNSYYNYYCFSSGFSKANQGKRCWEKHSCFLLSYFLSLPASFFLFSCPFQLPSFVLFVFSWFFLFYFLLFPALLLSLFLSFPASFFLFVFSCFLLSFFLYFQLPSLSMCLSQLPSFSFLVFSYFLLFFSFPFLLPSFCFLVLLLVLFLVFCCFLLSLSCPSLLPSFFFLVLPCFLLSFFLSFPTSFFFFLSFPASFFLYFVLFCFLLSFFSSFPASFRPLFCLMPRTQYQSPNFVPLKEIINIGWWLSSGFRGVKMKRPDKSVSKPPPFPPPPLRSSTNRKDGTHHSSPSANWCYLTTRPSLFLLWCSIYRKVVFFPWKAEDNGELVGGGGGGRGFNR